MQHNTLTQVMRLRGEVNALKKVTSANTTSKSSVAMTSLATGYTASGASYAPVDVDDTEPDHFDEHDDIEAGVLVHNISSAVRDSEVGKTESMSRVTTTVTTRCGHCILRNIGCCCASRTTTAASTQAAATDSITLLLIAASPRHKIMCHVAHTTEAAEAVIVP
jgi:hypothetical protein